MENKKKIPVSTKDIFMFLFFGVGIGGFIIAHCILEISILDIFFWELRLLAI
jgi:hypothetical protein